MLGACAIAAQAADYVEPRRTVSNPEINGSSGLVASWFHRGVFFTHNDGSDARIFAFDDLGRPRGTWLLEGLRGHDFEEMASAISPAEQKLFLADTGNNRRPERRRPDVFHLHLLNAPQPRAVGEGLKAGIIKAGEIVTIPFRYEGPRQDCEAIAIDSVRSQILLINKVPRDAPKDSGSLTNVYALNYGAVMRAASLGKGLGGEVNVFEAMKLVNGMPPLPEQITAMDIAPDGSKAVIQTYDDAYEFDFDTDWKTTLSKPYSRKIPVKVEPTGHPKDYTFREAICYGRDGKSLFITRELSSWEIENTNHRTPLWQIR